MSDAIAKNVTAPRVTKGIKVVTLGCRVNQYESEYLRQGFERLGYRDAADGEPVDLCIVNGCVVTAESEAKTRKAIRRLAKRHPNAEIIVVGCYAARAGEEAASMPGVVETVPDKRRLAALLNRRGLAAAPSGIDRFSSRRRAYVKVQDGCAGRCGYCIVPKVRPHVYSRPVDEIVDEVRRLTANGHNEVVLTGTHLGAYGRTAAGHAATSLSTLVGKITDLPGDFRVRLSSIEATEVTPELLALMAERRRRICPFLHLPLQSGSDSILRRMNRPATVREFMSRCEEIRAAIERPAICADLIVGLPGETEADFLATCRVVEEAGLAGVHVFRFSSRPGTPAAAMSGQVTNRIVQQRAERLNKLGKNLQLSFRRGLLGRELQVLAEGGVADRPGWLRGTSEHHAPVMFPGDRDLIGRLTPVVAESLRENVILARLASPAT